MSSTKNTPNPKKRIMFFSNTSRILLKHYWILKEPLNSKFWEGVVNAVLQTGSWFMSGWQGCMPACKEIISHWTPFFSLIKIVFLTGEANFPILKQLFFINLEISFSNVRNLIKDIDYFTCFGRLPSCCNIQSSASLILGKLSIISPFMQVIFLFFHLFTGYLF